MSRHRLEPEVGKVTIGVTTALFATASVLLGGCSNANSSGHAVVSSSKPINGEAHTTQDSSPTTNGGSQSNVNVSYDFCNSPGAMSAVLGIMTSGASCSFKDFVAFGPNAPGGDTTWSASDADSSGNYTEIILTDLSTDPAMEKELRVSSEEDRNEKKVSVEGHSCFQPSLGGNEGFGCWLANNSFAILNVPKAYETSTNTYETLMEAFLSAART